MTIFFYKKNAETGKYAVGAFNVYNMEGVEAVVAAAEEERSPAILQVRISLQFKKHFGHCPRFGTWHLVLCISIIFESVSIPSRCQFFPLIFMSANFLNYVFSSSRFILVP